jgi:hypothetical protein
MTEEKTRVRSIRFPVDLFEKAQLRAAELNKSFNSYIQALAEKDITKKKRKLV